MNNNQIQVNELFLFNMVPYMICKITAKTIFLKQCRKIALAYMNGKINQQLFYINTI